MSSFSWLLKKRGDSYELPYTEFLCVEVVGKVDRTEESWKIEAVFKELKSVTLHPLRRKEILMELHPEIFQ